MAFLKRKKKRKKEQFHSSEAQMEYTAISVLFWVAMPLFGLKFTKVVWVSHIHAISISISIFPLSVALYLVSKHQLPSSNTQILTSPQQNFNTYFIWIISSIIPPLEETLYVSYARVNSERAKHVAFESNKGLWL